MYLLENVLLFFQISNKLGVKLLQVQQIRQKLHQVQQVKSGQLFADGNAVCFL